MSKTPPWSESDNFLINIYPTKESLIKNLNSRLPKKVTTENGAVLAKYTKIRRLIEELPQKTLTEAYEAVKDPQRN